MAVMNKYNQGKCTAALLVAVAFSLTNIPCCASQRNFMSLGSKIENKNPQSSASSSKKKSFFGAAAAELAVEDEKACDDDGEWNV